jgi:hypothetical protein
LWHLSDEEDILQSVKSALDPNCAANTNFIPEAKPSNKKCKVEDKERHFRQHMSSFFDTISFSTLCHQIMQTQKTKANIKVKWVVLAMDNTVKAVFRRRMNEGICYY